MTSGRRRLLPWLLAQAQSGRFPGLEFDDAARSALRVPWERAGRGGAGGGAAAALCQAWAEYKGATPPPGPAVCKTRLRCALHKSPELQEVPERARLDGPRPYKVYRLLGPRPPRNGPAPRRGSKGRKEEAEPRGDDATPPPSPEEEEEEAEPSPAPPPPAAVTPPPSRQLAILLDSPEPLPPAEGDAALGVSLWVGGALAWRAWLPAGEYLLLAAGSPAPGPAPLPRLLVPAPPPPALEALGAGLGRGLLVASGGRGLFLRTRPRGRGLALSAPHAGEPGGGAWPQGEEPLVAAFDSRRFREELQRHRQGLGPPPEHRVLLAATPGELRTGGGASAQGAVLQLEQALAQRLLGPAPDPAN
ncbi:interferon regulatory factor 9 isoform X2 [Anas platyrhynchos]|uniref:interferon regulatory factor 9 isoform X2 n=1 Tax=Anas platyrhynchos TaxID=8839 RepID=UPI003AF2FFF4